MKSCTHCGRVLPESRFSRNRAQPDGLQCWCKDCVKDPLYQGLYYRENRDILLPRHRQSALAAKRRRRG